LRIAGFDAFDHDTQPQPEDGQLGEKVTVYTGDMV
jgi:hypothetical protein